MIMAISSILLTKLQKGIEHDRTSAVPEYSFGIFSKQNNFLEGSMNSFNVLKIILSVFGGGQVVT